MKLSYFVAYSLLIMLVCSCSLIAPDPSSNDIKNLTIDLCKSLMRDQLIQVVAPQKLGMSAKTLAYSGYPELKYTAWYEYYEEAVHGNVPNNPINDVVDEVDSLINSFEFSLGNIRIVERNFSTRRTDYVATLTLKEGAYVNVTAYAQYTTDEQIYVVVESLEPPNL